MGLDTHSSTTFDQAIVCTTIWVLDMDGMVQTRRGRTIMVDVMHMNIDRVR